MLDGYSRRMFYERRNLAMLYCWIERVAIGNKASSTVERLIPDPESNAIHLEDCDSVEAFEEALAHG